MLNKILIKLQNYILWFKYINIEYIDILLEIIIYSFIITMLFVW